MQLSLYTVDWTGLTTWIAKPDGGASVRGAPTRAAGISDDSADDDDTDDPHEELWDLLSVDPITSWTDSYMFNASFGEVFATCEAKLSKREFERLAPFVASFCPAFGEDGRRFPVPQDADLRAPDVWHAVMAPKTVRALVPASEAVDRRAFRAAVRAVLLAGKVKYHSVGVFFDYFDMFVRAYRLAASRGRGAALHVG